MKDTHWILLLILGVPFTISLGSFIYWLRVRAWINELNTGKCIMAEIVGYKSIRSKYVTHYFAQFRYEYQGLILHGTSRFGRVKQRHFIGENVQIKGVDPLDSKMMELAYLLNWNSNVASLLLSILMFVLFSFFLVNIIIIFKWTLW